MNFQEFKEKTKTLIKDAYAQLTKENAKKLPVSVATSIAQAAKWAWHQVSVVFPSFVGSSITNFWSRVKTAVFGAPVNSAAVATQVATEEATQVATEEATEEATQEAIQEAIQEATQEAIQEAIQEAAVPPTMVAAFETHTQSGVSLTVRVEDGRSSPTPSLRNSI